MEMLAVQSLLLILAAFFAGAMIACFMRRVFFARDNESPSPRGGSRTATVSETTETTTTTTVETSQVETSDAERARFGRALTGAAAGAGAVGAVAATGETDRGDSVHQDAAHQPANEASDNFEASAEPSPAPEAIASTDQAVGVTPAQVERSRVTILEPKTDRPVITQGVGAAAAAAAAKAAAQTEAAGALDGTAANDDTEQTTAPQSAEPDDEPAEAITTEIVRETVAGQTPPVAEPMSQEAEATPPDEIGVNDGNLVDAPAEVASAEDDVTTVAVAAAGGTAVGQAVASAIAERPQAAVSEIATGGQQGVAALRSVRSEALVGSTSPSGGDNVFTLPTAGAGDFDDLKRIRGIGVLIEKKLNAMGVRSYEQIANWTAADVARVSETLDFKGRIERESWIEQARILASGGYTDFSRRGG